MNIKGISSKKGLTISAILGAGILLSAIASPVASTWAQQLTGNNSSNNNNAYTNELSTVPKINGSVKVIENIKNMFKENAKVSFTAASETAQKQIPNGTILGGHLGVTQGYLTYTYFVVDPNRQTGYSVIIDAGNGKVLYTSQGFPIGQFNNQEGPRMFASFGGGGFGHWNNLHGQFGAGARAGGFWH
ncbi:MAG TPA: PepSY domain-containing protein [Nitrososphaeraceae archaeon]